MKRKLIIALICITALAGGVSYQVYHVMQEVTFKLGNIISIYKIQTTREKLGFQLRRIQEELVAKETAFTSIDPDAFIEDVIDMETTMHSCFGCHHERPTEKVLQHLQEEVNAFKATLSRVFTIRANKTLYEEAAHQAYDRGQALLHEVDDMLAAASAKLEKRSAASMREVLRLTSFVSFAMVALPVCMLVAGLLFLRSLTKPIATLMSATDKLRQGSLDFRVTGLKDEFGKLGDSLNTMAASLANQMQVSQQAEQMTVVGQMAAGLAHEIKNPLAGIKASMEVLKEESYIHEQDRQMLSMVISVINRVNSLINDLLHFARPSPPHLHSIPINPLLEQLTTTATYSLARPHATAADRLPTFSCETRLSPGLPNVMVDPRQIQQIVLNLIINAFDAMPQGGAVTVASAKAQDESYVEITVTDTGPGIPEQARDKIFIPFFSTKKKGTGLGLAICKTLAEKNGGSIKLNDTGGLGAGASFSLFLPVAATGATP